MRTIIGRKGGDGQASCDAEWCGGHREMELSNKGVSVFFGWRIYLVKRRSSLSLSFFFFLSFFLFNYWLHWVFFAAFRLSLWQTEATLHCGAQASHCSGFSCCRAQALGARASEVVAHRLRCLVAYGIFLDQGLNPCPLHWQAES